MKNSILTILALAVILYSCSDNSTNPVSHSNSQADSVVKLIAPVNASAFPDSSNITFQWRKTLSASSYVLEISTDSLFRYSCESFNIVDTSYSKTLQCTGGCVQFWHVRMNLNSSIPIWSETRHWSMNCP